MLETVVVLLQVVVFFVLPAYLIRLSRKVKANKIFGDIVICYGIGMLMGNTRALWLYSWSDGTFKHIVETISTISLQTAQVSAYASVLLAIPMLLMINHVTDWVKYTGKITVVVFMGILATIIVCITVGYLYRHNLPDVAIASGMMTGVYVGGTPNMVAISKALEADDQLFIILNATDTICSGLYFLVLLSIGKMLFGILLKPFQSKLHADEIAEIDEEETYHPFPPEKFNLGNLKPVVIAILVALGAVVVSAIPASLLPGSAGGFNQTVLMLTLTTIGITLSFNSKLRTLPGVFGFAQYLLLIFGLAAGYMSDFINLIETGGTFLGFNALIFISIILLHLLFALLIRSDVDSFMISSTATIMGPPFVAQVATSLKNKELLPIGIALSLLGFGLANYAGVFVAWVVNQF